jgi:RNA polymerase sigma-70 factor, ECF subfamily
LRDERSEKFYTLRSMDLEQPSIEELVGRAIALFGTAEGDRLVNELFERHYTRVACWCLRFTGDKDLAADLAQEIFTRAHQNLKSFQRQSKFSTWLYAIARNQCFNAMKARSLRPLEADEEALAELPGDDSSTAQERERSVTLAQQLLNEALDETERKVFTLHYGDELTLSAITRLLGLTNVSGAKAYIVSAKRKLNRCLQRWKARGHRAVLEGESS